MSDTNNTGKNLKSFHCETIVPGGLLNEVEGFCIT